MDRSLLGAVTAACVALSSGAALAQGFSGSGAAGYAQSQGWTASAGVHPRGFHGSLTALPARRTDHDVAGNGPGTVPRRARSAADGPAARDR